EVLHRLREKLANQGDDRERRQRDLEDKRKQLEVKTEERHRVVALFRRGRIDEATLDRQLDSIEAETAGLQDEIESAARALDRTDLEAQFRTAESLLALLRKRLDEPISPEIKRRLIEILVDRIEANTVEELGIQSSELTITYRFGAPRDPAPLVLPRSHRL